MEHPVEAALGGQELPLVSQGGHDLGRWQRGVLRLVADRQDLLPLLVAQPMGHVAGAAFTAVPTVPITRKLAPPALQGAPGHGGMPGPIPISICWWWWEQRTPSPHPSLGWRQGNQRFEELSTRQAAG